MNMISGNEVIQQGLLCLTERYLLLVKVTDRQQLDARVTS